MGDGTLPVGFGMALAQNQTEPVPEPQGKAKRAKQNANPIVAGTFGTDQKVFRG